MKGALSGCKGRNKKMAHICWLSKWNYVLPWNWDLKGHSRKGFDSLIGMMNFPSMELRCVLINYGEMTMCRKHTSPTLHQGSHNGGGPNAVGRWQASHPVFSLGMLENSYWRAAVGLLMNMGRYSVHSIYLLEIRAFILLRNLKVWKMWEVL